MNREQLEQKARKIQEEAKQAQAGLQTIKNLQECYVGGHRFVFHILQDEFHQILQMSVQCSVCKAGTDLFEDIELIMPDDEDIVGGLAAMSLEQIDVESPEEVEEEAVETEEVKTEYKEEQSSDGTYKVDVSSILGKKGEKNEKSK